MPDIFTKGLSTNSRRWSDLDLDFKAHPVTGDIVTKTDVEAVKRSLRNLILTNRYERPFQPEIDSGVNDYLFELATPLTILNIKSIIRNAISNFEERVEVIDIKVYDDIDRNGFNVTIIFNVINTPDPVTVDIFLERLR
jgi:phage baseplate assembly protein W|tara:strand:- start:3 stop:419 length:417 start_codon:yes stop_codon:yes gene_type:complete